MCYFLDFCFDCLDQCFDFLSAVEIFGGVTLFQFSLALIVISVVIFGLISTVKISAGGAVGVHKRHVRERRSRKDE